ncbi:class I SAM-dependent methyltransferase [Streptomyces sp. NBC_00820]|uniref:class I SAM-dependent methyltransferase n=1 Tax=Streptomyces sp. NBC_00820 TaxID=2975842 RepID=UPI002ED69DA0|nr:class I SAM-dependent methyltransferase [Streptomyces sp. NBC_00820]
MTKPVGRISATRWDAWHREGRAVDRLVSDAEVERVRIHVDAFAGASALDVGCGSGGFARQLRRWGYDVLGLDVSPAAIGTARKLGTDAQLRYEVHDFDSDAPTNQLQPDSFDIIVCRNVLPFIDHQRFMGDARRWLRPGGQVYVLLRVWPGPDVEPRERPWQRGFTEEQVQELQNGWAGQARCWLGRHTALFLTSAPSAGLRPGLPDRAPAPPDRMGTARPGTPRLQ